MVWRFPALKLAILEPGLTNVLLWTDYGGHWRFFPRQEAPYQICAPKPGIYQAVASEMDVRLNTVRVVLKHEQIVEEQVNVTSWVPGIDPEQTADEITMNTPEIVNIPYQTSRDIRYLLPFNPGVVPDATGQIHVAGSDTRETLDEIDGFDVRSPVNGQWICGSAPTPFVPSMRRQPATRSNSAEPPVECWRFTPEWGTTSFASTLPTSFHLSASSTASASTSSFPVSPSPEPVMRNRAWFFDGLETEYDNIYITELPANADTNQLIRGSNPGQVPS